MSSERTRLPTKFAERGCTVVDYEPGAYVIASLGPVVMICHRSPPGPKEVDAFSLANAQVARRHPNIGHLLVCTAGSDVPQPDERLALVEVLRSFDAQIACAAVVLEDDGLVSAVMQGVVKVIDRMGHTRHPTRFFHDVGTAATWLCQALVSAELSVDELQQLVQDLQIHFSLPISRSNSLASSGPRAPNRLRA